MRLSLIVFVLFSSFAIYTVSAQTSSLLSSALYRYYHCKFPSTTINDAFFQNALSSYTTFSSAMSFYKDVYTDINTTSTIYSCFGGPYSDLYMYSVYAPYFLDSAKFNEMIKILSDFKSAHTQISFSQYQSLYSSTVVSSTALDKFIYMSDYTTNLYSALYPSVMTCVAKAYTSDSISCITQFSNSSYAYNETTWPAYANSLLKCYGKLVSSCDQSTQRMLMFEVLAAIGASNFLEFPNGIISYIDSLIESGSSVKEKRVIFWIAVGNSMSVELVGQNDFQICEFSTTESTTIISTTSLSIVADFKAFAGGRARGISKMTLTFTNGGLVQTISLNIDNSALPSQFSNNKTTVQSSTGQNWLTINNYYSGLIIINDQITRVSVAVSLSWDSSTYAESYFNLYIVYPSSMSLSGLISTGCQNLDPDTPSSTNSGRRRKRAIESQTACNSSLTTTSSSDPTMTSSVVSNMCNYIVQQTNNPALASSAQSASSALNNVRSVDTSLFSHAAPTTSTFLPLAVLLSLCAIFLSKY